MAAVIGRGDIEIMVVGIPSHCVCLAPPESVRLEDWAEWEVSQWEAD